MSKYSFQWQNENTWQSIWLLTQWSILNLSNACWSARCTPNIGVGPAVRLVILWETAIFLVTDRKYKKMTWKWNRTMTLDTVNFELVQGLVCFTMSIQYKSSLLRDRKPFSKWQTLNTWKWPWSLTQYTHMNIGRVYPNIKCLGSYRQQSFKSRNEYTRKYLDLWSSQSSNLWT